MERWCRFYGGRRRSREEAEQKVATHRPGAAGRGLGQAHHVLELQILVQFGRLLGVQAGAFLPLNQGGDVRLGLLRRPQVHHVLRRRAGGDKIDEKRHFWTLAR